MYLLFNNYLVKANVSWNSPIKMMTIKQITEKCYHIEWENGHQDYVLKKDFESDYEMIECLGNKINQFLNKKLDNA